MGDFKHAYWEGQRDVGLRGMERWRIQGLGWYGARDLGNFLNIGQITGVRGIYRVLGRRGRCRVKGYAEVEDTGSVSTSII